MSEKKEALVNWVAPEYKFQKKSTEWYWFLWTISIFLILFIYFVFDDASFAFLIFFITIAISIGSTKKPQNYFFEITEKKIIENGEGKIKIEDLETFNFDKQNQKLLLKTKSKTDFLKKIPIDENSPLEKIEELLAEKEISKDEDLEIPKVEIFMQKIIGF